MKFKAEHSNAAGGWIIKIGRARNGQISYTGKVYETQEEAERKAAYRNADEMMRQMKEMLPEMELDDLKEIGFQMNSYIDSICDRLEIEDPEHDSNYDQRGWLA